MAGLGAMLPDLWRMADRQMRARPGLDGPGPRGPDEELVSDLLRGIEHHLEVDAWFHVHPAFVEGERALIERFRASELRARKMGLFAHIAWELCLDGALLRRIGVDGVLAELRQDLARACEPGSAAPSSPSALDRTALRHRPALGEAGGLDAFARRLEDLLERLAWGDWIPGYAHGSGIVARLGGVRRRVGLGRFEASDARVLAGLFEQALREADQRLDALLAVRSGPLSGSN